MEDFDHLDKKGGVDRGIRATGLCGGFTLSDWHFWEKRPASRGAS